MVGTCGYVENSYATGDFTTTGGWAGGLVGEFSTIKNCFSSGNVYVSGDTTTGCLGGRLYGTCNVTNSYTTGDTSGAALLLGYIEVNTSRSVTIDSCYAFGGSISDNNCSFINTIKANESGITNFDNVSITNCSTNPVDINLIKYIKDPYWNNITFDTSSLYEGISYIDLKDNNINLQIGINGNNSSSLSFAPKLEFDLSEVAKNIETDETLNTIDEFINLLSEKQTQLGSTQNRLVSVLEEISIQRENLVSSRSTIRDADIAEVSSEYIKMQILQQASSTLLATANQTPSIALQLI